MSEKETTENQEDLNVHNLALHNRTSGSTEVTNMDSSADHTVQKREVSPVISDLKTKDDDEESLLTNIDYTSQESNEELNRKLNLSEYCISSDADTEKIESDSNGNGDNGNNFPPRLSSLIQETSDDVSENANEMDEVNENKRSLGSSDEGTSDAKKRKMAEEEVDEKPHENAEEDDGNEVGDEGEADDVLEDEEEDEVEDSKPDYILSGTEDTNINNSDIVESFMDYDKNNEITKDTMEEEEMVETKVEPELDVTADYREEEGIRKEEMEENKETDEEKESEEEEIEPDHEEEHIEEEEEEEETAELPDSKDSENMRVEALNGITEIEYKFAELRQKLYETKLFKLEIELQMCLEGSHPELRGYYEKIASVRDYKLRRAYQRQKYELNCIDIETHATRTFIHQAYYKRVNDLKNTLLDNTTQQWYDINKERRDMDVVVPEVSYHVPIKTANKTLSCVTGYAGPARQLLPGEPLSEDLECENIDFKYKTNPVDKLEVIVDRMRLNNELSDLQGLKKYFHGFPGAPSLNSLRDSEINEDFEFLHLHLQPQPQPQPQAELQVAISQPQPHTE